MIHKPNLYLNIKKNLYIFGKFKKKFKKSSVGLEKKNRNNYPHLKRVLLTGDFFFNN